MTVSNRRHELVAGDRASLPVYVHNLQLHAMQREKRFVSVIVILVILLCTYNNFQGLSKAAPKREMVGENIAPNLVNCNCATETHTGKDITGEEPLDLAKTEEIFEEKKEEKTQHLFESIMSSLKPEEDWPHPEIDCVYTWVNGSDPVWEAERRLHQVKFLATLTGQEETAVAAWMEKKERYDTNGNNRYRDRNELMYSMRSVEKFAPFIRKIHVVVADGQAPHWLNCSHPKIQLVQHSQIFKDSSNLPTFNSMAIEANLLNIPGLSDYFWYFNDDFFLGNDVTQNDVLVSKFTGQQKLYYEHSPFCIHYKKRNLPECSVCPNEKMGNGQCDQECRTARFGWDLGDCGLDVITEGLAELERNRRNRTFPMEYDAFIKSLGYSIEALNRAGLRPPERGRRITRHVPYFFNKRTFGDLKSRLAQDFKWTEEHKFRHPEDVLPAFIYVNFFESVRVYAPTKKMAWGAAFRSIERNQTFLFGHEIQERMEKAHAFSIQQTATYAQVKSCAEHLLKHQAAMMLDLSACDQAMERLVYEQDLRLPYGANVEVDPHKSLFVQLVNNETKSLSTLNAVRSSSLKFFTINDDMTEDHPIIDQAYSKMLQTLFPNASAFENV